MALTLVTSDLIHSLDYSKLTGTTAAGTVPTWNQNTTGNAGTVTNGVYTVGNQTIAGVKTFSSNLKVEKSLNGDPQLIFVTNPNSGTATEAVIYVGNAALGATSATTFMQTLGTGFSSTGGFIQDGSVIGTGTDISGGLSLMVRANADMRFYTNGHTNQRMIISSGGNVGIGTTSPSSYYADKLVVKCDSSENGITIASNSATDKNYIMFAVGTTLADRYKGQISYNHQTDTLAFATNSTEKLTISSGGLATFSNDIALSRAARTTIYASYEDQGVQLKSHGDGLLELNADGGGNVSIGANGGFVSIPNGIVFNNNATGGTAPAKVATGVTLNAYEEGTFTVTLNIGGTNLTGYTNRTGVYTRVGRIVYFSLRISLTTKGNLAGNLIVLGLPFAADGQTNNYSSAQWDFARLGTIVPNASINTIDSGQSHINLRGVDSSGNFFTLTNLSISNTSDFIMSGTYVTS